MLFRSTDLLNGDLLKDFERLTKGLNFGPDFDQAVDDLSTSFAGATKGHSNLDIVRSDENVRFYIDLPGVDPADVELTIDSRKLTVSTTRTFEVADSDTHVHAGRRHGDYSRTFKLTDDLDADALSARSEHGVLIVTIPVIAAPEPRKIEITH